LDEVLGLTTMIESELTDNRTEKNTQHGCLAMLRQSVYNRLAGYEDTNDAQRLPVDPAMRLLEIYSCLGITSAAVTNFSIRHSLIILLAAMSAISIISGINTFTCVVADKPLSLWLRIIRCLLMRKVPFWPGG